MLKVKLLRKRGSAGDAVLCGFTVEGHAEFDCYGKDIVCAGVSAIAQAALFGLVDILGDAVKSEKREGYLHVDVEARTAQEEGPRAVLRTFELAAEAIRSTYPDRISLETEEGLTCC